MIMFIKYFHCLKEDNFIGHSMGGYGAIKFALTQSYRFSKAAMLSAPYDVSMIWSISMV